MPRRLVSTLLIVSYVASQLAALPHAHASQPAGHGQQQHVHGGWLANAFASRKDSGHTHSHHHHHHHGNSHSHGNPHQAPLLPVGPAGNEHDDDCVYLPYALVAAKEVCMAADAGQFSRAVANLQAWADFSSLAAFRLPEQTSLPGCGGEHCALYLTLRTLRI